MPFLEFIYSDVVLAVVLAFLVAGGTLLPTDEFKKFKVAKACWWLLALYLCGRVLMWSVLTSERLHVRAFWVFLACGIIGVVCSEMVRAIDHREMRLSAAEQDSQKPVSPIQQTSQGGKSPNTSIVGNNNVVGDNNTINYSDPKVMARLDEIKKLLQAQQHGKTEDVTRKELLQKYPLGYVVFDVNYQNSVIPYASQRILDKWKIDWNAVKIIKNTRDEITIQMPAMHNTADQIEVRDNTVSMQKKVGGIYRWLAIGPIEIQTEILAVGKDGIVFLIGLSPRKS